MVEENVKSACIIKKIRVRIQRNLDLLSLLCMPYASLQDMTALCMVSRLHLGQSQKPTMSLLLPTDCHLPKIVSLCSHVSQLWAQGHVWPPLFQSLKGKRVNDSVISLRDGFPPKLGLFVSVLKSHTEMWQAILRSPIYPFTSLILFSLSL